MTKSNSAADYKARYAAFIAVCNEPAYSPYPEFDPFEDTPKPRRRRRFTLSRAITQAKKSGASVTVAPDGGITLQFGNNVGDTNIVPATGNAVDDWMARHAR